MMSSAETMAMTPLAVDSATTLFAAMHVTMLASAALGTDKPVTAARERTSCFFSGKGGLVPVMAPASVAGPTPFTSGSQA